MPKTEAIEIYAHTYAIEKDGTVIATIVVNEAAALGEDGEYRLMRAILIALNGNEPKEG